MGKKLKIKPVSSLEDLRTRKFFTAVAAEFMGVSFLVLLACGACINQEPSNVVRISLGFAFSIATLVWATAHVSGGHLNPAVTVGFLVTRRITVLRALFYIVAQSAGGLAGAAVLNASVANPGNLCTSTPTGVSPFQLIGIELLITFVLVWTVFATVDDQRTDLNGSGPLAIGLAIGMCHLWAAPLTGAGMNPARVFGPAVVSSTWTDHWAYWIGPFIGAIAAAFLYDFIFSVNASPSKFKGFFTMDYNNDNYDRLGQKEEPDENSELRNSGTHSSKEASYGAMDGRLSSGAEA